MTKRDHHHPRTLVFQQGETVTVTVHKKNPKALTRLLVKEGLKPKSKKTGVVNFLLPAKPAVARLLLDTGSGGTKVTFSGSAGTLYQHLIKSEIGGARWDYRIVGLVSSRTYYVCPEKGCERYNIPIETRPPSGRCPKGNKAKLVEITF
jgi:hypothetical protein